MAAIASLKAVLGIDNKQFKAGVRDSTNATKTFSQKLSGIGQMMGVAFSAGAVINFARSVVSAAAKLEKLESQFVSMGAASAQAAQHMKDLREFATRTPFQLEDIAAASQQFMMLSEGTLGGIDTLKLFGDVAATAGGRFEDVAYWVGRFYAALRSGEPITRALNALLRIKAVGATTVSQLKEMESAGDSGVEIWDKYRESLVRFEGAMERLSQTTTGRISTMKDNWIDLKAAIGDVAAPGTKAGLKGLTGFMQNIQVAGGIKGYLRALVDPTQIGKWYYEMTWGQFIKGLKGKHGDKGLPSGTDMPSAAEGDNYGANVGKKMADAHIQSWRKERERIASEIDIMPELKTIGAMASRMVDRSAAIRRDTRGAAGSDSMAAVGIHAGPGRKGMLMADRQLKVQVDLRRLAQEQLEELRTLTAEAGGRGE